MSLESPGGILYHVAHPMSSPKGPGIPEGSLVRFPCSSSGVCQENRSSNSGLLLLHLGLLPIPS